MTRVRSVKKNAIANYIGQAYVTFIGIVVFPLYLQYLGPEGYGLIGFFLVLQTWLSMLDAGLSPMLNREIAASRARPEKQEIFRKLLRSVEIVFGILAVTVFVAIYVSSDLIATHWLNVKTLDFHEVAQCVSLMGAIIGLRFFSAIYRSGLSGIEAQVAQNSVSIAVATFKSFGALALLHWVSTAPLVYFLYQFLMAAIEPFIMGMVFYRQLPPTVQKPGFVFSWSILRPALPFGLSLAYTSAAWIVITQLDKLLLSGLLPLKEYGYFAIVATISTGVIQLAAPIGNAILPRMTYLVSGGLEEEMIRLYRKSSQVVAAIMLSVTLSIALFGEQLVYAWTGSREAATWASPVLFWYMLGNAFVALMSFQYFMQYAHGNLRLHLRLYTLHLLLSAPLIAFAAYRYGALGTGRSWFAIELICFSLWPAVVHRAFAPGLHAKWLLCDIVPVAAGALIGLFAVSFVPTEALNALSRPSLFAALIGCGTFVFCCATLGSSYLRGVISALKRLSH
ncbi:MAG: oligosaccharide flippase family protein [Alphaproteobacteria bacterium]|nr:oligosaccharide flippase family protein [Alphaproteobacteria bacterium]